MKHFHLLLLVLVTLTFSCQQDEFAEQPEPFQGFDFEIANLMVRAVDIEGNPVPNATAYASMNQFTTDANGLAFFPNIRAYPDVFNVKTIADGYAPAFANVKVNRKNCFVEMVLVPNQTQQFQSNQAQQIAIGNQQAKLDIPANAFVDAQGNNYDGTITAELVYISPEMENFGQAMPGADFMGIDENGEEQFLVSYGAISAKFFDANGQELQLAPESPATIELPIPTNATETPTEIPMWYFDEEENIWVEEGKAILQGDKYIAQLNHFTWWNCDDPVDPKTFVKGTIVDCDNNPLEGVQVQVGPLVTFTNAYGNFQVNVAPNLEFEIVVDEIYEPVYVSGVNQNDVYNVGIIQPLQDTCPLLELKFKVADCNSGVFEANYFCSGCLSPFNGTIVNGETKSLKSMQNQDIILSVSTSTKIEYYEFTLVDEDINAGTLNFCDECLNNDCSDNGICINGNCLCDEGYYGEFCENFDPNLICNITNCNNGTLIETEENCYCQCEEDWFGPFCDQFFANSIFGDYYTDYITCSNQYLEDVQGELSTISFYNDVNNNYNIEITNVKVLDTNSNLITQLDILGYYNGLDSLNINCFVDGYTVSTESSTVENDYLNVSFSVYNSLNEFEACNDVLFYN